MAYQFDRERIFEGETLRGVEREYRDLALSLKALAALLRTERQSGEPVLARILDSELNQLSVLVGEICVALKVEERGTRLRRIDLGQALRQAARRAGIRAMVSVGGAVPIEGDPEVVSQAIQSSLALAVRMADGSVTVRTEPARGGGKLSIRVPSRAREMRHHEARLQVVRRLVRVEGGRLIVRRDAGSVWITLWFPGPKEAGSDRRAPGSGRVRQTA